MPVSEIDDEYSRPTCEAIGSTVLPIALMDSSPSRKFTLDLRTTSTRLADEVGKRFGLKRGAAIRLCVGFAAYLLRKVPVGGSIGILDEKGAVIEKIKPSLS